jgi:hypothetical protein
MKPTSSMTMDDEATAHLEGFSRRRVRTCEPIATTIRLGRAAEVAL